MLQVIWDTRGYFFWLLAVSLFVWLLERLFPWRKEQKALRKEIGQDLFFLIFNGHYAGILVASLGSWVMQQISGLFQSIHIPPPESIHLMSEYPVWMQFIVFFLLKDFLEWCIHNLLHRIPWLWEFHKLHHSIRELDWIGNMRFHWMEIVVYKSLSYFPLVVLGVRGDVILWIAIISTLVGHLNHSNLNISWGPFRYIINSPRMHVWHHDIILRGDHGKNFGVVFSLWDWIFGTAYMPMAPEAPKNPEKLGFDDIDEFPDNLFLRLVYPFIKVRKNQSKVQS